MKEPVWVLQDVVHALHERLLSEFGGASGVRDDGMLESALSRPVNQFAYGSPTLTELAAAYAYGLVRNHPFVDGNKRIGFATAVLFLELNGYKFTASEVDATIQTLALAWISTEGNSPKWASL
jgi:death-on-curing protein